MKLLRGPARLILKLLGWKLIDLPQRPSKAVVIAYPHTSNWDFPVTLLALAALPYGAQWVAKDTLFRGMLGPLMRGLGGVAVNRRERTGFVERVADEFGRRENFHLIIATEGTRRLQAGWKSGFYRIARGRRRAGDHGLGRLRQARSRPAGNHHAVRRRNRRHGRHRRLLRRPPGCHHENASPIRLL
jgi:hypothetical protein